MHSVDFASGFLKADQLFALPLLCGKAPLVFDDACIRAARAFGRNQRLISNSFALLIDLGAINIESADCRTIVVAGLADWAEGTARVRLTNYLLERGLMAELAKAVHLTPSGVKTIDPLFLFPRFRGLVGLALGIGIISRDAESGVITVNDASSGLLRDSVSRRDYSKYERVLTPEQLQEIQGRQQGQGAEAEEFILNREKRRLANHPALHAVKRISLINVSAGFDIQSFSNDGQVDLNRFLEVKSYQKISGFFWSIGEVKAAADLKDMYYLVIVDMARSKAADYVPAEIRNPYAILDMEKCIKSASSSGQFTISPTGFFVRLSDTAEAKNSEIVISISPHGSGVDLDVGQQTIESV